MHLTYAGTSLTSQIRSYLLRSGSLRAAMRKYSDCLKLNSPHAYAWWL